MVKLRISMVVAALALVGCAAQDCKPTTDVVKADVIVPDKAPQPPAVSRPALPIAQITGQTSDSDTIKLYTATVRLLQGYATELETILDGYRVGKYGPADTPTAPAVPGPH